MITTMRKSSIHMMSKSFTVSKKKTAGEAKVKKILRRKKKKAKTSKMKMQGHEVKKNSGRETHKLCLLKWKDWCESELSSEFCRA